jgi:hypothetical protein
MLVTGNILTSRAFEMICLHDSGWADEEGLRDSLRKLKPPYSR